MASSTGRGSGPCFTAERLCWRWAMDDAQMIMESSRSLSSFEWCTNQRRAAEMASISNWAHTLEAMREDQRLADFICALRGTQRGDLKLGWQLEVLHGNELPHGSV